MRRRAFKKVIILFSYFLRVFSFVRINGVALVCFALLWFYVIFQLDRMVSLYYFFGFFPEIQFISFIVNWLKLSTGGGINKLSSTGFREKSQQRKRKLGFFAQRKYFFFALLSELFLLSYQMECHFGILPCSTQPSVPTDVSLSVTNCHTTGRKSTSYWRARANEISCVASVMDESGKTNTHHTLLLARAG